MRLSWETIGSALSRLHGALELSQQALDEARREMDRALEGVIPKPNPGEKTHNIYWCTKHFVFVEKDTRTGSPWKGPKGVDFVTSSDTNSTTWPALCHEDEFFALKCATPSKCAPINSEEQWMDGGFSKIYPLPERHIRNLGYAGPAGGAAILSDGPLQERRKIIQDKFKGPPGAYLADNHMCFPPDDQTPMKLYFYKKGWDDIKTKLRAEKGQLGIGTSSVDKVMAKNPTDNESGRDFFPDTGESPVVKGDILIIHALLVYLISITP
jgi:hypothetical protein